MNIGRIIYSIVLMVFLTAGLQAADKFVPDRSHTNIGFTVDYLVITTVPGKFTDYSVDLQFDTNDLDNSSVKAIIKTASINTDDEKRDNHLRSADFFDAEKYPEITFVSSAIMKNGEEYVAKGTLNMRGVAKEVELPFKVTGPVQDPWGNTKIGIEATLSLNRQDYGISWSKSLDAGGLVVSDNVKVELDLTLIKEG
jgi:polyisoprenoid-binding protein YceI